MRGKIRLLVAALRSVAGKEAFYASAFCVFLVRQQFLFSASRFFLHFLMRVLLAVTKDVLKYPFFRTNRRIKRFYRDVSTTSRFRLCKADPERRRGTPLKDFPPLLQSTTFLRLIPVVKKKSGEGEKFRIPFFFFAKSRLLFKSFLSPFPSCRNSHQVQSGLAPPASSSTAAAAAAPGADPSSAAAAAASAAADGVRGGGETGGSPAGGGGGGSFRSGSRRQHQVREQFDA